MTTTKDLLSKALAGITVHVLTFARVMIRQAVHLVPKHLYHLYITLLPERSAHKTAPKLSVKTLTITFD